MKYLGTSAIALVLASGAAYAETHMEAEVVENENVVVEGDNQMVRRDYTDYTVDDMYADSANLIRTRDITGGDIYSMGTDYTGLAGDAEMAWSEQAYTGIGDGWNDIGEIEDIILSRDGQMIGIIAEVGGFFDIGDKHVMIPVNDVSLVPIDDETYAYVTRLTEEQLEQLEGVDEGFWN
ncbi:PRC-barrel domain-containing protein [Citreimonas salinaria]|uniref:PRC-barrel domain-containing protein n=1 Tax=Citreimonas salinaria TaxID=321339 RepID=A0A1H3J451_9RHOB|nr:PRC-barrel domain-containing protein [Citreimonas salinaria]SDY34365.1 PRC-barrel domain-containing protein [Citreimonas salinaria]